MKYNVSKFHVSKVLLEPCVFTALLLCCFGIFVDFLSKINVFMCFFTGLYPSQLGDKKTCENTSFGITPTQNPVFLQPFLVAGSQNPVFLQSFWPDSALPWLNGLLPGLQTY